MAWLQHRSRDAVSLGEALADAASVLGSSPVCLLYLPFDCVVARLLPDGSLERDGAPLQAGEAFEARAFSQLGELRWVHEVDGHGRAVVVAEEGAGDLSRLDVGWSSSGRIGPVEAVRVRYVLWGRSRTAGRGPGWTWLKSPRTGDLLVPLDFPGENRPVYLHGSEYVGRVTALHAAARDDGNAVVLEELLRVVNADEGGR